MADVDTLKWLWSQTYSSEQKEQLLARVAASADDEALKWFWNQSYTSEQKATLLSALTVEQGAPLQVRTRPAAHDVTRTLMEPTEQYDVFISHASEDKDSFVRLLAQQLTQHGVKVWYDEFTLSLGDSLRRSIDRGLAASRFGVVVLSHSFFAKEWPQKELDGLVAREDGTQKVILPIWHNVTKAEVARHSPMLADRIAVSSQGGVARIVKEILQVLKK